MIREQLLSVFVRLHQDNGGATLVEYGLLATCIALGCIGAMSLLGVNISCALNTFASDVAPGLSTSCSAPVTSHPPAPPAFF